MADEDGALQVLSLRLRLLEQMEQVRALVDEATQPSRSFEHVPVNSDIGHAGIGVAHDGHARSDKRSRILLGVGDDREPAEITFFSSRDHLLDGSGIHLNGRDGFVQPLAPGLQHRLAVGYPHAVGHPFPGGVNICEHSVIASLDVFKKDGGVFPVFLEPPDHT